MKHKKQSAHEQTTDVSWVINRKGKGYTFFAHPILIDAAIDKVWTLEKDVERYEEFSEHAVRSHVDGPVAVDKKIRLDLYTNVFLLYF